MSQIVDVGQSMKTPSRVPSERLDVFDIAQVDVDNQNVALLIKQKSSHQIKMHKSHTPEIEA
jgi:hypothetical protein